MPRNGIGSRMAVPDPADACEVHRWAVKAIATGEQVPGPLLVGLATDECRGCLVCQTALELAREVALGRSMDRPLRFRGPMGNFWAKPRYRSDGLNVDPAP